jgi:hypothetical protein
MTETTTTVANEEDVVATMQFNTMIVVAASLAVMFLIALTPMFIMLVTGDFPGSSHFYGLQEDNDFVTFLLNVRNTLVGR